MDRHRLRGGRYAVVVHEGPASTFAETMRYIFVTWLPASGYQLDQREHFEVLTKDYDPTSPDAREEVWVPIK
jgi:AraC family transcriptional regulator